MPKIVESTIVPLDNVFIDREEATSKFMELYKNAKAGEFYLLNYFGIPGAGKTHLRNKLQSMVLQADPSASIVKMDFQMNVNEPYECLERLASQLNASCKIQFPVFSVALSYYCARKYGIASNQDALVSYFKTDHPFVLGCIGAVLGAFVDAIAGGVGISSVISELGKGLFPWANKFVTDKKVGSIDIIWNDLTELERLLPHCFAFDYNNGVKDRETPIVFFVDTYEKYVNKINDFGDEVFKDLWLRDKDYGLIPRCDKALWVIFGRERLEWDKIDAYWEDKVEGLELKDFTPDYAREFLNKVGIEDLSVVRSITVESHRVPFHLSLLAEYYKQQVLLGMDPKDIDFSHGFEVILKKYVEGLNPSTKCIIYFASCLGGWTDDDLKKGGILKTTDEKLSYDLVKKLSFVNKDGDNRYYLHSEAEDILQKYCPDEIRALYEEYVNMRVEDNTLSAEERVHFIVRRIRQDVPELSPDQLSNISTSEKNKRATIAKSVQKSFDLNKSYLEEFLANKKYSCFETVIEDYLSYVRLIPEPEMEEAKVSIDILEYYISYCHVTERFLSAGAAQNIKISMLENAGVDDATLLIRERYKAVSYLYSASYFDKDLQNHLSEMYEKARNILGETDETTLGVKALLDMCVMNGKGEYDMSIVKAYVDEEKRVYGENTPRGIKSEMELAYFYKKSEDYENAIKVGERLIVRMEMAIDKNDRDFIHAIDNLAIAYLTYADKLTDDGMDASDKYKRAITLENNLISLAKENGIDSDLEKRDYFNNLCSLVHAMVGIKDFLHAEDYCREILRNKLFKTSELWQQNLVYDTIATSLQKKRNFKDAAYFVDKVYGITCKECGKNSPEAIRLLATREFCKRMGGII